MAGPAGLDVVVVAEFPHVRQAARAVLDGYRVEQVAQDVGGIHRGVSTLKFVIDRLSLLKTSVGEKMLSSGFGNRG